MFITEVDVYHTMDMVTHYCYMLALNTSYN